MDFFYDVNADFGSINFKTVLDIGANVGQTARLYYENFPNATIYSFEPVKATFTRLQSTIVNEHLSRVHSINSGAGDCNQTQQIHLHTDSLVNSIINAPSYESASEAITIVTLDLFIQSEGIDFIDLLKIDTEGYEIHVLKGASDILRCHRAGIVFLECAILPNTAGPWVSLREASEALVPYGYSLYGIYDQTPQWKGDKDLAYCNAAFISPALKSSGASQIS